MNPVARETGTREKILAAGAQAVSAKSFNSCGLSEILELAGVPKGSFYHYFQSKEDFGVALIEHEAAEFMAYLRPIVSDRKRAPLERPRATPASRKARKGSVWSSNWRWRPRS
jgi:TetR/AcrR family transcriptional repressor of nem operon